MKRACDSIQPIYSGHSHSRVLSSQLDNASRGDERIGFCTLPSRRFGGDGTIGIVSWALHMATHLADRPTSVHHGSGGRFKCVTISSDGGASVGGARRSWSKQYMLGSRIDELDSLGVRWENVGSELEIED